MLLLAFNGCRTAFPLRMGDTKGLDRVWAASLSFLRFTPRGDDMVGRLMKGDFNDDVAG